MQPRRARHHPYRFFCCGFVAHGRLAGRTFSALHRIEKHTNGIATALPPHHPNQSRGLNHTTFGFYLGHTPRLQDFGGLIGLMTELSRTSTESLVMAVRAL